MFRFRLLGERNFAKVSVCLKYKIKKDQIKGRLKSDH